MTENIILEALQKFLQDNVAAGIKLRKPTDGQSVYELVNPSVYVGWISPTLPKDLRPEDLLQSIPETPCILISMDGGEDAGNSASMDIRLTFITYGGEKTIGGRTIPDLEGYKDINNLRTRAREELAKAAVIGQKTVVQQPFTWSMYEEQPYPHWMGWLKFKVSCAFMVRVPDVLNQYI